MARKIKILAFFRFERWPKLIWTSVIILDCIGRSNDLSPFATYDRLDKFNLDFERQAR